MSIKQLIEDEGMQVVHMMAGNPTKGKKLYAHISIVVGESILEFVVTQDSKTVVRTKFVDVAAEIYDNL